MKKKGLSAIIAVVLIILMVVLAMALLWLLVSPFVENKLFSEQVSSALMEEKFSISYVGEGKNPSYLEVVISRGATELMELAIENVTETIWTVQAIPTDIMLLVDLSGSMDSVGECIVGGVDLNYPGSFCDSSETLCVNTCGGTYSDGICTGENLVYSTQSCVYRYEYNRCTNTCGGEYRTRLDILNDSAKGFVDQILGLNNGTNIALLGFSSYGSLYAGFPSSNFTNNSVELYSGINDWWAEGNTYLYQGLQNAYNNFTGRTAENKILIVLGDGDCNDDSNCDSNSIGYISNFNTAGIKVHTIGFGAGVNVSLFQGIADASSEGEYHDSTNINDIAQVFEDITGKTEITELVGEEVSIWGVFLDITVFANGESFVHRIKRDLPGSNEGRKYSIDLEDYSPGLTVEEVTKVEIYLVAVSQGAVENSVLMARYNVD